VVAAAFIAATLWLHRASGSPPAPAGQTAPANASHQQIMAVVQRANDEQQQAFARHDPTVMRDTATSEYYDQLSQALSDLAKSGVVAIKLVSLDWGPITVQGSQARATTYETWETTFRDGSTTRDRARNDYTLVLSNGVWLIQSDDQSDGSSPQISPAPGTTPPSGAPGGVRPSGNWAGYVATGGTFTAVSGRWTVPQVTGSAGMDATWVGIGGAGSRDLIQAGTDATVQGPGQIRYTAWIELLPQFPQTVPLAVHPGDVISTSLVQQGNGDWLITIENQTTGRQYQKRVSYTSSFSSAEWIEEAPASGRRILPLDDFGRVTFSGGSAVKDGKAVTIAQAGAMPLAMIDRSGAVIAQPSALGSDGASFTVTRVGAAGAWPPF
jgi:hypothetical protein